MNFKAFLVTGNILCFISPTAFAQSSNPDNDDLFQIHITPTTEVITIDGDLNEPVWSIAQKADNFWQTQPIDGVPASHATIAYITYDEQNIYVGAVCYDDMDKHFVRTLKRDDWEVSDEFGVMIDPIGQKAIAYGFGTNVLGSESEGLITAPNIPDFTWDNRWTSAVKQYEDRW